MYKNSYSFPDSFGLTKDFEPIMGDLRILYQTLKSCGVNVVDVMFALFRPHLSSFFPFNTVSLPFEAALRSSGFRIGFMGSFPAMPMMVEVTRNALPPRQKVKDNSAKKEETGDGVCDSTSPCVNCGATLTEVILQSKLFNECILFVNAIFKSTCALNNLYPFVSG